MKITIEAGALKFQAEFNDTKTAKEIYDKLPIESSANTWGDEIYFDTGLRLEKENLTLDVKVGDITYWPEGGCLCIFFGRTPASVDDNPRPASGVCVVGRVIDVDIELLRSINYSDVITVSRADQ